MVAEQARLDPAPVYTDALEAPPAHLPGRDRADQLPAGLGRRPGVRLEPAGVDRLRRRPDPGARLHRLRPDHRARRRPHPRQREADGRGDEDLRERLADPDEVALAVAEPGGALAAPPREGSCPRPARCRPRCAGRGGRTPRTRRPGRGGWRRPPRGPRPPSPSACARRSAPRRRRTARSGWGRSRRPGRRGAPRRAPGRASRRTSGGRAPGPGRGAGRRPSSRRRRRRCRRPS